MEHQFSYDKKKVIQALRYHFISRPEIKIMMILVNVFAITAAILFYSKKIRPEPFLLGTTIWLSMMVAIWYILPNSIYKRSATFKDSFSIFFREENIVLENGRGQMQWQWKQFSKWFESPHFFHLYFDAKSFFIVPKEDMTDDKRHELRALLRKFIAGK